MFCTTGTERQLFVLHGIAVVLTTQPRVAEMLLDEIESYGRTFERKIMGGSACKKSGFHFESV